MRRFSKSYFIIAILVVLFCQKSHSQTEIRITGTVTDNQKKPVSHVDVLLRKNDSIKQIIAFGITDLNGRFQIIHQTNQTELILEISSLTYQTSSTLLTLDQRNQVFKHDFVLNERIEELEEVEVSAAPRIQVQNDTTKFNLNKLRNGTERVVEDILEKLPGIIIDDKGRLKFKGKDVVNVLMDGDNLFSGNYTIATKNINASHITGIEAIENFEENPLLQGLSENDEVALNLKFGTGISLSGSAELSSANLNLYSINTTLIEISKKLKGFSVLSNNRIGDNLNIGNFNASSFIETTQQPNNLNLDSPDYIANISRLLSEQGNVKNNQFFGSLNALPKLSDTETLRVNIDILTDDMIEEVSSKSIVNFGADSTIQINQTNRKLVKPFYLNSKISYTNFLSEKKSLSTDFFFSRQINHRNLYGFRNDEEQTENLSLKEILLLNRTALSLRLNQRSALSFEALLSFMEKPSELVQNPGISIASSEFDLSSTNVQNVYSNKKALFFSANYYHKTPKQNKLRIQSTINNFESTLKSNLSLPNDTTSINQYQYSVFYPEFSVDYLFQKKQFSIRPYVSESINYIRYNDSNNNQSRHELISNTNGSLRIKYEMDKRNQFISTYTHFEKLPEEKYLYSNYILSSNRVFNKNSVDLEKLSTDKINFTYRYDNLLNSTNIRLSYSYEKNQNSYLSANSINENTTFVTHYLRDLSTKNRIWEVSFSKYLNPIKSTFILSGSFNSSEYYNFLNDLNLRYNKSSNTILSFQVGTSFIGKFLFGNTLFYAMDNFTSDNNPSIKNEAIRNKFSVAYVPMERIKISSEFQYQIPNLNNFGSHFKKWDISLSIQNKQKSLTYFAEVRNLLNQTRIDDISNNDYSYTTTTNSIFDRLFLIGINFKY